jgi:hypothetical protein
VLRSRIAGNTGPGERVADAAGKVPGAESSSSSRKRGNGNTTLTQRDTLDMLKSALSYFQQMGGVVLAQNSQRQEHTLILVLPGVEWCQKCGSPRLFEDMLPGGVCQECQK